MRYVFDIYYWGEWSFEKAFDSLDRAKRFAEEFSQDQWRIVDSSNGNTLVENDPLAELERQAALDIGRFARSDEWVARMANQRLNDWTTRRNRRHVQSNRPNHSIFDVLKPPRPCFSDKVNWLQEGF